MKTLVGKVISAKNKNTITVLVERLWEHPLYQKKIKRSKKYAVHTEDKIKEGLTVKIGDLGKKISKTKSWKVVEVLKK
jgi:small subunit ribosomal protein S17